MANLYFGSKSDGITVFFPFFRMVISFRIVTTYFGLSFPIVVELLDMVEIVFILPVLVISHIKVTGLYSWATKLY